MLTIADFSFGEIVVDGSRYDRDLVIDRHSVRKRKKKPSKRFRDRFGHTPLSLAEAIPWKANRLIVGTGAYGRMPVMDEVREEARRRNVTLVVLPTSEAIRELERHPESNAILHITC